MILFSGSPNISPVDTMVPKDVSTWRKNNKKDNHDAEEDEGNGGQRDILQVTAGKCFRHR